jgi:streptogramin lyase
MRSFLVTALALPAALVAQEVNWVADRVSVELHAIDDAGRVVNVINLSGNASGLRSVHKAPDGKLWVVNFILPFFTIVDPATSAITNVTNALGSPFKIAFDAQGHGWVSGGSGVVEYDAAGVQVGTHPLTATAPLGITIDNQGNKWIAHRTTAPGSISRIDPAGVVTNYVPPTGGIQPTDLIADFRGILVPSHIWVIGDNAAGDVYQFDENGNFVNLVTTGSQLGAIAQDANGKIWVGSFSNGNLFEIDPVSATIVNTFNISPGGVFGLAVDGFGNLWETSRLNLGPPPSEVRRVDKSTGAIQVPAIVGTGTGSALSTLFQYAMVVDPFGDLDGDGIANVAEILAGDNPFETCSLNGMSATIRGSSRIGTSASLDFIGATGFFYGFANGIVPPGSGVPLPGIGCAVQLDLTMLLPGTGFLLGPSSVPLAIPNNAIFQGTVVFMQALALGSPSSFTNTSALKIW